MDREERFDRTWWGSPWFWVVASLVLVFLGFFVFPAFFGGLFLFFPLLWISARRPPSRRRPGEDV